MNNRELKFRIWDKKSNKYLSDVGFIGLDCDGQLCNIQSFSRSGDGLENYTIQQSTGLKDKNGKEIYEGDIYRLIGWDNLYYCYWYNGVFWNRKVNQSEEDFIKNYVNVYSDSRHTLYDHYKYAQVIGNIFENPELLK